jgi:hypothetical protein
MTWRVERQHKLLVGTNYIVVYDDDNLPSTCVTVARPLKIEKPPMFNINRLKQVEGHHELHGISNSDD